MRRCFAAFTFVVLLPGAGYAQEAAEVPFKKSNYYIGVQANQLIRQLFSFGSVAAITNPYLITYAINSRSNGAGFATGLGYNYNQTKDGDNFFSRETTINDFFLRIGVEKKAMLTRHWMSSFGLDIVLDRQKDKTTTISNGSTTITTETKSNRTGLGPRCTLGYVFSGRIIVGTEASYYFKSTKEEQKITGAGTSPGPAAKFKSFTFSVPAVLYLTIKF